MKNLYHVLKSPSNDLDQGWSWVVLFASFLIGAMTWGVQQSIGVIYSIWIREFKASKIVIAWITSFPMFLLFFLSPVFQIIQNHSPGYQLIAFLGALFYGASFLATSFVSNEYLLFLTYSFPMGIGLMLMATPIQLVINQHFQTRLSSAMAICTTGSFIFSMVLPPALTVLITSYGWKKIFQFLSLIIFVFCTPLTFIWRKRESDKIYAVELESIVNNKCDVKEKVDMKCSIRTDYKSILRNYNFRILLFSFIMISIEGVISLTHIVQYAVELDIDRKLANLLPTFISAGNVIGRIIFGRIFDLKCVNKLTLWKTLLFMSGVIALLGSFSQQFIHLVVFSIVYGAISGAHLAQGSVIIRLVVSKEFLSYGFTLTLFFQSFTLLAGSIMVGWISELLNNYKAMFYITSAAGILSSIISMFLKVDTKSVSSNIDEHSFKEI